MNQPLSDFFSHQELSLRQTEAHDIPLLVPIINEAYSYQDEAKGAQRTNTEHLTQRITEVDFYTLLEADEIVGCVYLEPKANVLHFGLLTLVPRLRGKGVGDSLIQAIESYARSHHFETISLDYMSLAPWLNRYYEKFGFRETKKVTRWGKIDLIEMRKNI
ncbi:MAG: GNAT family N-acetyltransferase [Candidatus Saccharimonadales bacterium]